MRSAPLSPFLLAAPMAEPPAQKPEAQPIPAGPAPAGKGPEEGPYPAA